MALSRETKAKITKKFANDIKDTGNVKVQIALLTEKINALTTHLKNNHKDNSSHRGLMRLVGQRKSLLNYLERTDRDSYLKLIKDLKLRK